MCLMSINPATGAVYARYPEDDEGTCLDRLAAAEAAQRAWRVRPLAERVRPLRALAGLLRGQREDHARRITAEMGKPLAEARAELEKCAWAAEHYADEAERYLAEEPIPTEAQRSFVCYRPLGVILAIMPWNFPYWQVLRSAVPALAAGNAVLLKHAPNVPGAATALVGLFEAAGFPEGLVGSLLVAPERVPARVERLIADPQVAAVTLTGSPGAGRAVAACAGRHLKPCVLELGGSDPYVVLADADLPTAAAAAATGRLINNGQSCIAAKRLVVVDAVREAFTAELLARMAEARVGDPGEESVTLGPLARGDLRATLHAQVSRSVALGARCLLGGRLPPGPGWFYPATVLAEVRPGMPAHDEETFGPVAAVVPARDEAEALALANASAYGLGAAVFTGDRERGERLAAEVLEAGSCFVNTFVRSDPRLPFGGIKASGFGRELGPLGIRAFTNAKTVFVA